MDQRKEYYKYFFNHKDGNVYVKHYVVVEEEEKDLAFHRRPYICHEDGPKAKYDYLMDSMLDEIHGCGKCYVLLLDSKDDRKAVDMFRAYLKGQVERYRKSLEGAKKRLDIFEEIVGRTKNGE